MTKLTWIAALSIIALLAMLTACGGGSDRNENILVTEEESTTSETEEPEETTEVEEEEEVAVVGNKEVYDKVCIACHQSNGMGVPGSFPPLVGEWVNGEKPRLINVVLQGLSEEIEVNGETYNGVMPQQSYLSDEEIAGVLTYIRNSFGNNSSEITPEEVAAERAKLNQ